MPYKIFFSGLIAFVEYNNFEEVDAFLLNPCASQHEPGEGEHEGADHERSCLDRHLPQLTVKATDIAEWNLAGTLHGCGSHHFDLTGKTVFSGIPKGPVDSTTPPDLDTYPVDPFGDMRQVSFQDGIVNLRKVLGGNKGIIDTNKVTGFLKNIGNDLIAARVRLPQGKLTALAPLDTSARQVVKWDIGEQKNLFTMCETVMFEPADRENNRIDLGNDEFVQLKNKPVAAAVWITAEPRVRKRFQPEKDKLQVLHFEHFYELLPPDHVASIAGVHRPLPQLALAAFNTGTPPCPEAGASTSTRIRP